MSSASCFITGSSQCPSKLCSSCIVQYSCSSTVKLSCDTLLTEPERVNRMCPGYMWSERRKTD